MRKNKSASGEEKEKIPFIQQVLQLPKAMQKRFTKQMLAALIVVGITTMMIIWFKTWTYSVGYLIALYIAYLGFDNIWTFQRGNIICKRMVCIKAISIPGTERLYTMMKEQNTVEGATDVIHNYYIALSLRDKKLFTMNTVIDIYYNTENPSEVVAWEIVDCIVPGSK